MDKQWKKGWPVALLLLLFLAMLPAAAAAFIPGDGGISSFGTRTFTFSAMDGRISMGDGETAYMWGYASSTPNTVCPAGGCMQYPGPTMIVNQGETVLVRLTNLIPTLPGNSAVNASIVFPGQNVTASGGVAGLLTREATPGQTVTYQFVASQPGTYTYYSGTNPDLQVEMGLVGALIVRPSGVGGANCPTVANPTAVNNGYAYCARNAYFDYEYLFLATEIDPAIHRLIEFGNMSKVDLSARRPTAWFFNGRNFPDTVSPNFASWLPSQPYSTMPMTHPLSSVLMRVVSGGRSMHPFHTHGQNHSIIARDGRLLQSSPAAGLADMPISDYTTSTVAGETVDAIWGPWTGKYLNWDIFGPPGSHTCNAAAAGPLTSLLSFLGLNGFDANTGEWCADHNKVIPVAIPAQSKLTFGAMYGGTPYIGIPGSLPPIDPNTGFFHSYQNPMAGLSFMWHSHAERELTTNNIFIGGMATMSLVLPYKDGSGNPINIP